jgi:hypothetical protein
MIVGEKRKNEKKVIGILFAAILVMSVAAIGAVAVAKPPTDKIPNGPAGNSNIAHLYLCEKDPTTWQIVEDGAWGKMKYNLEGPTFDFVFNGHGLENNTNYSLVYYADYNRTSSPQLWGGDNPGALIANGTSNEEGNIHLAGSIELNMDLPCSPDWNINPTPDYCDYHNTFDDYDHCSGAKIWLVPSADYNATAKKVIEWNPTEYLFESDLITYDDTEV